MKYDNEHNSMRSFIAYDVESKYATSTVFADSQAVYNFDYEKRQNDALHLAHAGDVKLNLWEKYE